MMQGLLSTDSAAASLPSLFLMQAWQSFGWAVVAAAITMWLLRRWAASQPFSTWGAGLVAAWVAVPGVWGGHHWLGLAFQAPSITTVLVCGVCIGRYAVQRYSQVSIPAFRSTQARFVMWLGVVCGWILLLDTLGVFPFSLYNWGFCALAPALALCVLALPWVLAGRRWPDGEAGMCLGAVGLFVTLQLPTGNLLDALLDPWLWVALHVVLVPSGKRQT